MPGDTTAPSAGDPAVEELLEREADSDILSTAIASACRGEGGVVVIEAAAGMGKTSLIGVARRLADGNGMQVLSARAGEMEADFAYCVARQLFEPALARQPARREAMLSGAAAPAVMALDRSPGEPGPADMFAVLHGLYAQALFVTLKTVETLALGSQAHGAIANAGGMFGRRHWSPRRIHGVEGARH